MKFHVKTGDTSLCDVVELHPTFVVVSLDTDERACVFLSDLFGDCDYDKRTTKSELKLGDEFNVQITNVEPGSRSASIRARQISPVVRAQRVARYTAPLMRRQVA